MIATSTKIDIAGVEAGHLEDGAFKAAEKKAEKKKDGDAFFKDEGRGQAQGERLLLVLVLCGCSCRPQLLLSVVPLASAICMACEGVELICWCCKPGAPHGLLFMHFAGLSLHRSAKLPHEG